jgi:acyl carrier protein
MPLADDRVLAVFRDVFQNPSLQLEDKASFEDISGWDSEMHVNLIVALEEEFGVKFGVDEVMVMNSVGTIRRTVAERIGV